MKQLKYFSKDIYFLSNYPSYNKSLKMIIFYTNYYIRWGSSISYEMFEIALYRTVENLFVNNNLGLDVFFDTEKIRVSEVGNKSFSPHLDCN